MKKSRMMASHTVDDLLSSRSIMRLPSSTFTISEVTTSHADRSSTHPEMRSMRTSTTTGDTSVLGERSSDSSVGCSFSKSGISAACVRSLRIHIH